MTESLRVARTFRVEGRVQGVSYRVSAYRKALQLGLSGWVRNTPDGAVEGIACGTAPRLAEFTDWLWQGPRLAQVTAVICADTEPVNGEFSIRN